MARSPYSRKKLFTQNNDTLINYAEKREKKCPQKFFEQRIEKLKMREVNYSINHSWETKIHFKDILRTAKGLLESWNISCIDNMLHELREGERLFTKTIDSLTSYEAEINR